jgi:antitoxin component YwqK of YwqJK toxin-antitoxin module
VHYPMKRLFFILAVIGCISSNAQYYYKDIIGTSETAITLQAYMKNKVNRVSLNSFDADGTKSEAFFVSQVFNPSQKTLQTITKSGVSDESILLSFINANGQVVKTIDSNQKLVSTALYQYAENGSLTNVTLISTDSSKAFSQVEEHLWQYENGKVKRMIRVKNKVDTMYIQFKLDDAGNVIEEQSVRNGKVSDPVYYYYDAQNRLTDIVRFNNKAKRLLPEYMFEYSASNQVIQKITVPSNGSQYLIWRYQYDERGLKIKEAIYNKQKQLTGKIEYLYSFGS